MHPEAGRGGAERRSEPRQAAEGRVLVHIAEAPELEFAGELLDISRSGFRAAHTCRELHSGQVVRFEHQNAAGKARVVWNRIADQQVESGFFIIEVGA